MNTRANNVPIGPLRCYVIIAFNYWIYVPNIHLRSFSFEKVNIACFLNSTEDIYTYLICINVDKSTEVDSI